MRTVVAFLAGLAIFGIAAALVGLFFPYHSVERFILTGGGAVLMLVVGLTGTVLALTWFPEASPPARRGEPRDQSASDR